MKSAIISAMIGLGGCIATSESTSTDRSAMICQDCDPGDPTDTAIDPASPHALPAVDALNTYRDRDHWTDPACTGSYATVSCCSTNHAPGQPAPNHQSVEVCCVVEWSGTSTTRAILCSSRTWDGQ